MQAAKEVRQTARQLLRASFIDGQLDPGRINSIADSMVERKPRNYLKVLDYYKRLLRLELDKRHARIETSSPLEPQAANEIARNLSRRYGTNLTTEFVVTPELLGGMRVRVGSDVWDTSVRNRLDRLEKQLN